MNQKSSNTNEKLTPITKSKSHETDHIRYDTDDKMTSNKIEMT